jgi:D-alanine-D-alanine ligase
LRIGLTYNLRKASASPPLTPELPEDYYIEFDDETTVTAIADALRKKGGHEVIPIEADDMVFTRLKESKLDAVFNIAEGEGNDCREAHVPAMLERLGIPYTGSGPLTLAIALNKATTNDVLRFYGIDTPCYQIFHSADDKMLPHLDFPLIVKPLHEGSSKGIRDKSLVRSSEDLIRQVSWVIEKYRQPAIVEEFINGREFTIALLGNNPPMVLPIVEVDFEQLPEGASRIYSYEAKWIWDTPEKPIRMFACPAHLESDIQTCISNTARSVFNALGCRDICRIDGRLDNRGQLHVLDVNPLPGMIPDPLAHSCLPEAAMTAGYAYDELINAILYHALKRYDLPHLLQRRS